jgi:Flp pilus assembly protein CpaB
VETIELARQTGALSLSLRSITDAGKGKPVAEDDTDHGNSINIVRFGVNTVTKSR